MTKAVNIILSWGDSNLAPSKCNPKAFPL